MPMLLLTISREERHELERLLPGLERRDEVNGRLFAGGLGLVREV